MSDAKSPGTLKLTAKPDTSVERRLAEVALDPLAGGAAIANNFSKGLFGETDLTASYEALQDRATAIRANKLGDAEDMLTGQAAALNAIFLDLARRAGLNMGEYIQAAEAYMRLALKAQAQCRATLETLANIKNPPVVYARQANIAAGPQQVNNAVASTRASEPAAQPNKLLEANHGEGEWLDPGTACTSVGSDPAMEAVGAVHRSPNEGGEGACQPKRRQGRKTAIAQG